MDFILEDGSKLSVKTNQRELGKVAPQIIGQPTSKTYFDGIIDFSLPITEKERVELFKSISLNETEIVMQHYWDKLFECSHLLYFYDVLDKLGNIKSKYQWMYIEKINNSPIWDKDKFKFTQSLNTWKECCTVKYE